MPPKKKEAEASRILLGRPKGTLKMGLVGLPNVGKSTTFNLLCKQAVPAENFPFCTIDPHEARMSVPDERFSWLAEYYKPKSEQSATLAIFDIAGLVPGAAEGEGLGNAFLSHIQAVDGIYHVVRAFEDEDVIHTQGDVDPDMERARKRYEDLVKLTARGQDKGKKAECEMMKEILDHLESGKWISSGRSWSNKEVEYLNDIQFLTAKPIVYLVNLSEHDFIRQKNKYLLKIHNWVKDNLPGPIVPYSANFEAKLAELETPEERNKYITHSGAKGSQLDKIINTGYETLNLIHYFTCGKDEVKCWTIRAGTKAPQAAGIIHSDMENGFICAEVTKFEDLKELGSESACKVAGKVATKGKDYLVENGDVLFFKFNPSGGGGGKK
ncbi:putative GTP-binding protein [Gregarina niphandrodes]|uniref:GTP-binding protein n=1 Tax=Gregarina niphandrodes TaxID=110365 RepID=A0A023BDA3_GRENI|nr:putative GTP-binding protein [Gregarina niphandrodes]EZG86972.1 putative GTP-binding protein [Gregarina niphandrodes]|eukprot:XP_011128728.1 putative GTP-binding protein [Gregarina niphandrodes]